jgi:hypothetical protein
MRLSKRIIAMVALLATSRASAISLAAEAADDEAVDYAVHQ